MKDFKSKCTDLNNHQQVVFKYKIHAHPSHSGKTFFSLTRRFFFLHFARAGGGVIVLYQTEKGANLEIKSKYHQYAFPYSKKEESR